jgi:hypothetical protein
MRKRMEEKVKGGEKWSAQEKYLVRNKDNWKRRLTSIWETDLRIDVLLPLFHRIKRSGAGKVKHHHSTIGISIVALKNQIQKKSKSG